MRALIPLLAVLASVSTIATAWWNLAIRRQVAKARLQAIARGMAEPVRVESKYAMWVRRFVTTCVVAFIGSALLMGAVLFLKSLWELFT